MSCLKSYHIYKTINFAFINTFYRGYAILFTAQKVLNEKKMFGIIFVIFFFWLVNFCYFTKIKVRFYFAQNKEMAWLPLQSSN